MFSLDLITEGVLRPRAVEKVLDLQVYMSHFVSPMIPQLRCPSEHLMPSVAKAFFPLKLYPTVVPATLTQPQPCSERVGFSCWCNCAPHLLCFLEPQRWCGQTQSVTGAGFVLVVCPHPAPAHVWPLRWARAGSQVHGPFHLSLKTLWAAVWQSSRQPSGVALQILECFLFQKQRLRSERAGQHPELGQHRDRDVISLSCRHLWNGTWDTGEKI